MRHFLKNPIATVGFSRSD